jgi:hypothetical protein
MSGHEWQDGFYDDEGTYVDGGWVLIAEDGTEVIMMDAPTDVEGPAEAPAVEGESVPVEVVEEVDLSGGPTEAVESD